MGIENLQRGTLRPYVAAAGLIVLLLIFATAGATYLFWKNYGDVEAAAELRVSSASQVVSANVGWAVETARQVLRRVDDTFGDTLAAPAPDAESKLRSAIETIPGSTRVYVVDASGTTRLTTDPQFKPIDVRDREYFVALASGEAWHVTSLLISRLNGEQIFAISKRIERNGQFAGAAIISFNSELMKSVWISLDLDEMSTVGLFRDDGQLVSRYPLPEGPMDLSKYMLFTDYLPNALSGTYRAVSPADGVHRIVGYRRIPNTNLIAIASLSTEGVFSRLNGITRDLLVLGLPAALGLLAVALWTLRLLRNDARRRAAEAQFRIFAEAMPNHVWTSLPDGRLDWFNARVYEYSGAAAGELDGTAWSGIVHPDDLPAAIEHWSAALSSGHPYETEFRIQARDGTYRWFLVRAVSVFDFSSKGVRWIGTNTDIEDQKQIANALVDSETRLQLAIDAGQLAVWDVDLKSLQITPSPALNRLYGFPPDATPSLVEYQARYAPGEAERVREISAKITEQGGTELEVEVRHLWPDGTEKWLLIRAQIPPGGVDAGGHAIGVVIDVTARKQVEEALFRSEQRFRLSQNAAGIASMEIDVETGTIVGSDNLWPLWGLAVRDSIHISELEGLVLPEDRHVRASLEVLATGNADPHVEFRIYRRDNGELRWLARDLEFFRDMNGTPTKMFGILQDITEQKQAQSLQNMLADELKHRIKNIITMVTAIAGQTLREGDLDTARQAFVERLRALANAHDILTRTQHTQASLRQVVEASSTPLPRQRINIEGPDIQLPPNMSLSMALAVHELGTNAVKYGSLSNETGRVDIRWSSTTVGGQNELIWSWKESGGPEVSVPKRRGFGSILISRVLGADFGGAVSIDYAADGLEVKLTAPTPVVN